MRVHPISFVLVSALAAMAAPTVATAKSGAGLTLEAINTATFSTLPDPPAKVASPEIIRAEVLLDRARFSPGAIDGLDGENFRKAISAYQGQNGLPANGRLDQVTWDRLIRGDAAPAVGKTTVTAKDAKGPFIKRIPPKMEAQSKLKRMGYRSLAENLSEQVHASPGLLRTLNPGITLKAGAVIVAPKVVVDRGAPAIVVRVAVDKTLKAVEAYGADNKLLAFYPASIGSDEKPAPSGAFTIMHVTHNPDYTYNPAYAFKGVKATKPFTIAPGPNNPVGSVWMALSDEGYGIHGTPEPDRVGKTQSHGCIRLTNWDVEDLASMVKAGTPVDFDHGPTGAPAPAAAPVPSAPLPAASAPEAPKTAPPT